MKRDGMMATVLEKIVREVDEADWEVIVLATPRLSREAQSCEHHCAATGGAGAARASGGGGGGCGGVNLVVLKKVSMGVDSDTPYTQTLVKRPNYVQLAAWMIFLPGLGTCGRLFANGIQPLQAVFPLP